MGKLKTQVLVLEMKNKMYAVQTNLCIQQSCPENQRNLKIHIKNYLKKKKKNIYIYIYIYIHIYIYIY